MGKQSTKIKLEEYIERLDAAMRVFAKKCSLHKTIKIDITVCQMSLLIYLAHHQKASMSDLAQAFSVTLGNMTGIIDRLIREKLIKREPDPHDRRIIRITLTAKGTRITKELDQHKKSIMGEILEKIPEIDRNKLLAIMENVVKEIQSERQEK